MKPIALALLCALLCLPVLQPTAQEEPLFQIDLTCRCATPVESFGYAWGLDGETLSSGGMCRADGDPILPGETFSMPFLPGDFPEGADLDGFFIELWLAGEDDTPLYCAPRLTFTPSSGEVYSLCVTGIAPGEARIETLS